MIVVYRHIRQNHQCETKSAPPLDKEGRDGSKTGIGCRYILSNKLRAVSRASRLGHDYGGPDDCDCHWDGDGHSRLHKVHGIWFDCKVLRVENLDLHIIDSEVHTTEVVCFLWREAQPLSLTLR